MSTETSQSQLASPTSSIPTSIRPPPINIPDTFAALEHNDDERLVIIHQCGQFHVNTEESFERIAHLCARTFKVPLAIVSFLDATKQWFKSKLGFNYSKQEKEDMTFYSSLISEQTSRLVVIRDFLEDEQFKHHPSAWAMQNLRFYAGANLVVNGVKIGTLCLLDKVPRPDFDSSKEGLFLEIADLLIDTLEEKQHQQLHAYNHSINLHQTLLSVLQEPLEKLNTSFGRLDKLACNLADHGTMGQFDAFAKETMAFENNVRQLENLVETSLQQLQISTSVTTPQWESDHFHEGIEYDDIEGCPFPSSMDLSATATTPTNLPVEDISVSLWIRSLQAMIHSDRSLGGEQRIAIQSCLDENVDSIGDTYWLQHHLNASPVSQQMMMTMNQSISQMLNVAVVIYLRHFLSLSHTTATTSTAAAMTTSTATSTATTATTGTPAVTPMKAVATTNSSCSNSNGSCGTPAPLVTVVVDIDTDESAVIVEICPTNVTEKIPLSLGLETTIQMLVHSLRATLVEEVEKNTYKVLLSVPLYHYDATAKASRVLLEDPSLASVVTIVHDQQHRDYATPSSSSSSHANRLLLASKSTDEAHVQPSPDARNSNSSGSSNNSGASWASSLVSPVAKRASSAMWMTPGGHNNGMGTSRSPAPHSATHSPAPADDGPLRVVTSALDHTMKGKASSSSASSSKISPKMGSSSNSGSPGLVCDTSAMHIRAKPQPISPMVASSHSNGNSNAASRRGSPRVAVLLPSRRKDSFRRVSSSRALSSARPWWWQLLIHDDYHPHHTSSESEETINVSRTSSASNLIHATRSTSNSNIRLLKKDSPKSPEATNGSATDSKRRESMLMTSSSSFSSTASSSSSSSSATTASRRYKGTTPKRLTRTSSRISLSLLFTKSSNTSDRSMDANAAAATAVSASSASEDTTEAATLPPPPAETPRLVSCSSSGSLSGGETSRSIRVPIPVLYPVAKTSSFTFTPAAKAQVLKDLSAASPDAATSANRGGGSKPRTPRAVKDSDEQQTIVVSATPRPSKHLHRTFSYENIAKRMTSSIGGVGAAASSSSSLYSGHDETDTESMGYFSSSASSSASSSSTSSAVSRLSTMSSLSSSSSMPSPSQFTSVLTTTSTATASSLDAPMAVTVVAAEASARPATTQPQPQHHVKDDVVFSKHHHHHFQRPLPHDEVPSPRHHHYHQHREAAERSTHHHHQAHHQHSPHHHQAQAQAQAHHQLHRKALHHPHRRRHGHDQAHGSSSSSSSKATTTAASSSGFSSAYYHPHVLFPILAQSLHRHHQQLQQHHHRSSTSFRSPPLRSTAVDSSESPHHATASSAALLST